MLCVENQMDNYYEHGGGKRRDAIATILDEVAVRHMIGNTLDIGCGNGTLLEAVAPFAQAATGVDMSDSAIELTRNRVPNATLIKTDVQKGLPLEDASFDSIFMLDIIEHLHSPLCALQEVRRILRAPGVLTVTTPNANSPLRYARGKKWFGVADSGHVMLFTAFTLAHLLRSAGFQVEMMRTELFTGSWIDRVLRPLRVGGTLFAIAIKTE